MHEFSSPETLLDIDFSQPVYVVVDRLAIGPDMRSRLVDSVEICYREGRGEAILEFVPEAAGGAAERMVFNERFECKTCGAVYQEPEPRLFSFNNPYGACPRCQGFGNTVDFDINLVIPDRGKSLNEGAIQPWTKPRYRAVVLELKKFARANHIPMDVPFRNLTAAQQNQIIEGDPKSDYVGVNGFFQWLERKKYKLHVRVFLSRYRGYALCPDCNGSRLRAEARAVRVSGKSITEVCAMTVAQARQFMDSLELSAEQAAIADKILEEIRQRLLFLDEVGLDYLSLDRLSSTLSGGEAQRIQLATSLGSHLVGALYVLDEPSIGLHPRDTHRLIEILKQLARPGQHDSRGRARSGHDRRRRLRDRSGARRGRTWREPALCRAAQRTFAEPRIADGALPERRTAHPRPNAAAQAERPISAHLRSARAQSAEHRFDDSAAHAGGDHGRIGIGKIHAGA